MSPYAFHRKLNQPNIYFKEEMSGEELQYDAISVISDTRTHRNLYVSPIPPNKYQFNPTYGSVGVVV